MSIKNEIIRYKSNKTYKIYEENQKTDNGELNEWRDIPCSRIGLLNIVKMSVLPRLHVYNQYNLNKNPSKESGTYGKADFKFYIEKKKTQTIQLNIEENNVRGLTTT